jgi:uncharacterized protein
MTNANITTPGVYINEINAFPNSVVPVATAVPAFIGYTPQAFYNGTSYINVPCRITSFAEFLAIYCYPALNPAAVARQQYSPQYYLVKQQAANPRGDYISVNGCNYAIVPDPNTIYYLYNSVRLFYQNGGGEAYIVSVGTYGPPSGAPISPDDHIVNPNVKLADLLNGLAQLLPEQEPTMYICPEATLLSTADNGTLMQQMLLQCSQVQTAISIFDVIGGRNPDPILYTNDIAAFRDNTGLTGLDYGTAYYPFVGTAISQTEEIDYTNLFGGDTTQLSPLLNPAASPNPAVAAILNDIAHPPSKPLTTEEYDSALLNASDTYSLIMQHVLADINLLPASGAMAGVMTMVDSQQGVWTAPANVSIVSAVSLPICITDAQQASFNVDPVTGKSINVIRLFNGLGIVVWGARTLDGNSQEWRYINVRRTLIFIEQSCKIAVNAYAFAPNDANTWTTVRSMLSSFLTSVWTQGGLQGASAAAAFSVSCGLGITMNAADILDGIMNVTIKVAVTHPAEFIVITLQQRMTISG